MIHFSLSKVQRSKKPITNNMKYFSNTLNLNKKFNYLLSKTQLKG